MLKRSVRRIGRFSFAARAAAALAVFTLMSSVDARAAAVPDGMPVPVASDGDLDLGALSARLLPAVVNISSTQIAKASAPSPGPEVPQFPPNSPFYQFFKDFQSRPDDSGPAPDEKSVSLGSGFVIDGSGLIVTNNHVIDGADKITVILQDHTTLKAELVGRDVQTDLALLRVKPAKPLPSVAFGDSDTARVGDWAIAIGNPYGLGGTVTAGIISAKARAINDGGPYDDFLQTDAAINKGNSGGPLFNLDGAVIGINSAIFSPSGGSIGIGFAIPSAIARHVVGELRRYHHVRRGWVGARLQELDPDMAAALALPSASGVILGAVVRGSPAARSGLAPGDVITAVDDRPVADIRRFRRAIADLDPGSKAAFRVVRDGRAVVVRVTLTDAAPYEPAPTSADGAAAETPSPTAPAPALTTSLGLSLAPVTPSLRDRYQLSDEAKVVVVDPGKSLVAQGGPLASGDVIVEADGFELHRPGDLTARVGQLRRNGRKSVLLLVDRGGDLRYVTMVLM